MICGFCGASNPDGSQYCSVCHRKIDQPKTLSGESFKRKGEFHGRTERMIPKTKTILPFAAGGILIINALLALGGLWLTNIVAGKYSPEATGVMTVPNLVFGGLALFVLVGGVLAMLRRRWALTLAASVASFILVIIFGLFCAILEALLSVCALVLLAQTRDEFRTDS